VSAQLADAEVASNAGDRAKANGSHCASLAAPVQDLTGLGGHDEVNPAVMRDSPAAFAVPAVKGEESEDEGGDRPGVSPCTDEDGAAFGSAEDEAAYYRTAGSLAELMANVEEDGDDFESVGKVKTQVQPVCDDCPDFEDI